MKRLFSLFLVLLLCSCFILSAGADAWIPPAGSYNEHLLATPYKDGDCYALNIFMSNFAETQLSEYAGRDDTDEAIKALLKHFELNANLYGSKVSSFVGRDGQRYMRIDGKQFESRMKELFGLDISASQCPGYYDGQIIVSAENYAAPITVFASVDYCDVMGDNLYYISFELYIASSAVEDQYGIANDNLSKRDNKEIGEGRALIRYKGSIDETVFHHHDFTLVEFWLDECDETRPYKNVNTPCDIALLTPETTVETTEASTEDPTEETHQSSEESKAETEEATAPTEEESTEAAHEEEASRASKGLGSKLQLLLFILVVIIAIMAISALVIILVVFKIKERSK